MLDKMLVVIPTLREHPGTELYKGVVECTAALMIVDMSEDFEKLTEEERRSQAIGLIDKHVTAAQTERNQHKQEDGNQSENLRVALYKIRCEELQASLKKKDEQITTLNEELKVERENLSQLLDFLHDD